MRGLTEGPSKRVEITWFKDCHNPMRNSTLLVNSQIHKCKEGGAIDTDENRARLKIGMVEEGSWCFFRYVNKLFLLRPISWL